MWPSDLIYIQTNLHLLLLVLLLLLLFGFLTSNWERRQQDTEIKTKKDRREKIETWPQRRRWRRRWLVTEIASVWRLIWEPYWKFHLSDFEILCFSLLSTKQMRVNERFLIKMLLMLLIHSSFFFAQAKLILERPIHFGKIASSSSSAAENTRFNGTKHRILWCHFMSSPRESKQANERALAGWGEKIENCHTFKNRRLSIEHQTNHPLRRKHLRLNQHSNSTPNEKRW